VFKSIAGGPLGEKSAFEFPILALALPVSAAASALQFVPLSMSQPPSPADIQIELRRVATAMKIGAVCAPLFSAMSACSCWAATQAIDWRCSVEFGYSGITSSAAVRIVLDTSVLVAAARSRNGASFQLLSSLPSTAFQPALTVALYTEWQAVFTRPEHLPPGAQPEDALAFLRYLASIAHLQNVHFLWRPFLRDPDDDMLLECAVASGSPFIVTHNIRDFRRTESLGVRALTPCDFLLHLRSQP